MTTETEVFALFEGGNPVPDLDGLGSDALDAAAYLATLETRSSEVTQAGYQINRTKGRQAISNDVAGRSRGGDRDRSRLDSDRFGPISCVGIRSEETT